MGNKLIVLLILMLIGMVIFNQVLLIDLKDTRAELYTWKYLDLNYFGLPKSHCDLLRRDGWEYEPPKGNRGNGVVKKFIEDGSYVVIGCAIKYRTYDELNNEIKRRGQALKR